VLWRRQDNMKFFSLNPAMRAELSRTLELFEPAMAGDGRSAR